jgi:hypothetical protein
MKLPPEDIFQHKEEVTAPAKEVMEHLHDGMIAIPEFTLKDGRTAKTEDYYAPEIGPDGELYFGVDVALSDDSHLEMTTRNSGWGGMVREQKKRGRKR